MPEYNHFINTSYIGEYVVVSSNDHEVVLRPVDSDTNPIATYWKEFLGLYDDDPIIVDPTRATIHLTQLPPSVLCVDAYVEYAVEFPRVTVHIGDKVIDVSDKVACNHPNPETPGLYALDFTLGEKGAPLWRSWVSIDEPPVLRHIITPWNRDNKVIADINRLVVEPRFMEALYEAGVPLYNFQQSNAISAVPQSAVMKYRDARAFVKNGNLFITGPQLPVGSTATLSSGTSTLTSILKLKVITAPFQTQDVYGLGDIVRYGGSDYYAVADVPVVDVIDSNGVLSSGSMIPGVPLKDSDNSVQSVWLAGTYYILEKPLSIPDGEYDLSELWATIDVGGYMFQMNLLKAFPVRHYWGYYNAKYFYDYAPGDLVSYVTDNIISFYQRNETTIDNKDTEEAYRPGNYRNPHWTEVYSSVNGSILRDPVIKPYTNATNAVVARTYPIRNEAFRIYARLVGMPSEIVDGLGPKYSVLLWALLYRTRETFPGFKAAMNAVGFQVSNLYRVHPSVEYSVYDSGDHKVAISNVYTEIDKVKEIARSVKADRIWYNGNTNPPQDDNPESPHWIRYACTDGGETDDTVYMFRNGAWHPFYSFKHLGLDTDFTKYNYEVNNRYYRAEINLMDRLKSECLVNLDDDIEWIDDDKFSAISVVVSKLISYEVPIYVYLLMSLHLATVGKARLRGVSGGVVTHEEWGGQIGLKVYPGNVFDLASISVRSFYPIVYYRYDTADSWKEYAGYQQLDGYSYYSFDKPVYVKFEYVTVSLFKPKGYWVSQFTIGCLGDSDSTGTEDYDGTDGFKPATLMDVDDPLYLCKGVAGVTVTMESSSFDVSAQCLCWRYILGITDESDPNYWSFGDGTHFAEWMGVPCEFIGCTDGDLTALKSVVTRCTTDGKNLTFAWDGDTLCIGGDAPKLVYLWDNDGNVRGVLQFGYDANMRPATGQGGYLLKVTFTAEEWSTTRGLKTGGLEGATGEL